MIASLSIQQRAACGPRGRRRISGAGFALVERPAVSRRRRAAFTLVELLIVVAVVALLVAMLAPSLTTAREYARRARCAANLRQIYHVFHAGEDLQVPTSGAWIAFLRGKDAGGVLLCPSDSADESGGASAVGMTGHMQEIDPPSSVVFDSVESCTTIHGFPEQDDYVLPSAVTVDVSEPGYYESNYNRTSKTIPAGTAVDSYFVFFDPVGSQSSTSSGSITMGAEIVGLIVLDATLNATDKVLGRAGTAYATGRGCRGFESGQERITLSADRRTLTINNFYSTFPGENVRILTLPGGMCSYGMNNQVPPSPRSTTQVLLIEYDKPVVDVDGEGHDDDFDDCFAPRHLERANVLFADGSVRAMRKDEIHPSRNPELWRR